MNYPLPFRVVKILPHSERICSYLQSARHFIRQAVVVSVRAKKRKSSPTSIAPITLAMAMSTSKRISEKSIVPKMPDSNTESTGQRQFVLSSAPQRRADKSVTARKPTAIPNNTQSRGVPTVSVPISVRNTATTPIIMLTITARLVQLNLHWQQFISEITSQFSLCFCLGKVILFFLIPCENR